MHSAKPNIWLFKSKKINHLLAFAFKPDLVAGSQRSPGSPIAIHKGIVLK
jgi:hypothetical protein